MAGAKWWFLWPYFCSAGDTHGGSRAHVGVLEPMWRWIASKLPLERAGRCAPIEFVQRAGHVVFVPNGWRHAVINIEPSVGISKQVGHIALMKLGRSFNGNESSPATFF